MSRSVFVRLQHYGVAVATVILALLLTLVLRSLLTPTMLPFFFVAVAFSTWYGGLETGIFATLAAVAATRYFLLAPFYTLLPLPGSMLITTVSLVLVVLIVYSLDDHLQLVTRYHRISQIQLRRGNTRFRAAMESSFDAIYLLESVRDRTGEIVDFRFIDLNEQGARLISRSKADILHQTLCDLLPAHRSLGFFEKYKRVVQTRVPLEEEFSTAEMSGVTAQWLHHQVVPLEDGIVITSRDITERKQAELEILSREQRYRTLAESMPQYVWVLDAQGQIEYANQHWIQGLGVTPDVINQMGWSQILHPEELADLQSRWQQSFCHGEPQAAEFRYRMADGSYRWFLGRVVPVQDESGQVVQWIGTSTDIDDRKRIEQALMAQEQQFRTLAENAPDVISRLDAQMRHLYVNSAVTKATGLPPEVFLGKTNAELGMPLDLTQFWYTQLKQVFDTGQPRSYEFNFPAPDGMRFYLARLIPESDAAGRVETVLGITSDITELKRTEQALRDSETRFRRVLESNMIGMGFWDIEGNILLANEALLRMIGYTQAEVQARQLNWRSLTPPEYAPLEQKALQEIAESGFCMPFEKEYLHKNGTRIPILCGGATFEDSQASGVFFVLDLTERKAIEKERDRLLKLERAARETAETANRIKDEFLAVLSHELRTPLNPILGWTKLLQARQFSEEQTLHALQVIERNARLQAQLIDDLLDISRILQGKLNLNFCPVNVVETVEAVIATMRLSAEAKAIQLVVDLAPTTGEVLGNQARLQQICWNLLSNAIKFTPHGGRVTVSVQPIAGFAQVQVQDTGQGIDAEFLPYVFDYFRQSDSTITRLHGGLGLGLAISRHLVELHGGTIEAASPGPGQGAIFTVQLPLTQAEPGTTLGRDRYEQIPLSTTLSGVSILVVEHELDTREFIRFVLEQTGAQVLVAASVGDALRLLEYARPTILVSDIGLPDEDGYSLMEQIQLLHPDFANQVRAIALTACASDSDQQETLGAGYHRHLIKPVEPDALIATVSGLIQVVNGLPNVPQAPGS